MRGVEGHLEAEEMGVEAAHLLAVCTTYKIIVSSTELKMSSYGGRDIMNSTLYTYGSASLRGSHRNLFCRTLESFSVAKYNQRSLLSGFY